MFRNENAMKASVYFKRIYPNSPDKIIAFIKDNNLFGEDEKWQMFTTGTIGMVAQKQFEETFPNATVTNITNELVPVGDGTAFYL